MRAVYNIQSGKMLRRRSSAAFSLIEIILVIALMGLLASSMAVSVGVFFNKLDQKPIEKILKLAIREARYQAAATKKPAFLSYDEELGEFQIEDEAGASLGEPFKTHFADDELEVIFRQILPAQGLKSTSKWNEETEEISRVTFHPDRSSTPFEVVLDFEGDESVHRYDPFSDTELREDED